MKTTAAFKKLIASLSAGTLESKKQQDHLFKILNGGNQDLKDEIHRVWWDNPSFEGFNLSDEQNKQGIEWLTNLWKSPTGKERKNNPFGYREQAAIENFSHFQLVDAFASGYYANYQVPVYDMLTKDGYGFQYYMQGGEIHIIG